MLGRFARAVARHPWWTIGGWLVGAVLVLLLAPPLPTDPDQGHSLPDSYESVQSAHLEENAFKGQHEAYIGGYVLLRRADGQNLTDADVAKASQIADGLRAKGYPAVTRLVTGPDTVAPDRSLTRISVLMNKSTVGADLLAQGDAMTRIRADLPAKLAGTGLTAKVGGDAASYVDNSGSLSQSLLIVTVATLILILGLTLLIFRGPLAALLPILTTAAAMQVGLAITAMVAKPFGLVFDDSLQIVILIVMFGIGADYFLFLLWRYRERLRAGDDKETALAYAVERAGKVIIGTAVTTMCAVLVLLLASFRIFQAWGPALAIAVGTMAVTALTLIPAVLRLLGGAVFWPSKKWRAQPRNVIPVKLGKLVSRRPAVVALAATVLMVVLAGGVLAFRISYNIQGGFPDNTESAQAKKELEQVVPGSAGLNYPAKVLLRTDNGSRLGDEQLNAFVAKVGKLPGVGSVEPPTRGTADPSVVRVNLLLQQDPFSDQMIIQMRDQLRGDIHAAASPGTKAYVGGISAGFADIDHATKRDLPLILLVAAVLIALILALVLRSVVAPLLLVPAVLLGFAAALGGAVYVFQGPLHEPGLNFQLPILLYLFVLAIGTDYNILMVSRLREESQAGHDPRTAAGLAVRHAAPIAAGAGLILAGTFSVMLLAPVAMMKQMGFAVALGIAVSAFVMAAFLVPALTALIGRAIWWPGAAKAGSAVRRHGRKPVARI